MLFEILMVIAVALLSGAGSAALVSWNCQRRILAVEEYLKVREPAVDDRLKQIEKIAIREMKSDAAKTRWNKKELEDTALASQLTRTAPGTDILPWDPRTWGGT